MPFTLKSEILLKDRTGAWYAGHPSWTSDQTLGINVSIEELHCHPERNEGPFLQPQRPLASVSAEYLRAG